MNHSFVGRLLGNPQPKVLPCGHVQLIEGTGDLAKLTVVDFEVAQKYCEQLRQTLDAAITATAAGRAP